MSYRVDEKVSRPPLRVISGGEARIGQGPSAQPVVEGGLPEVQEGGDQVILESQPKLQQQPPVRFQSILAKSSWSPEHARNLAGEVLEAFARVLTDRADREQA